MKENNVIYKTVEQECTRCGKHFNIRYCSKGFYDYVGNTCGCIAPFHPVDGEPSITEWLDELNEERKRHA